MIKIDNALLESIGLGSLPDQEKNSLLRHIYETLEMRVGIRLADQMTDDQLSEFERYFDAKDDAGAFNWLQTNFPNYKEIVQEEFDKLKVEVQSSAPQILSASQNAVANPAAAPESIDPNNLGATSPAAPVATPPAVPLPPQQTMPQAYPAVAPQTPQYAQPVQPTPAPQPAPIQYPTNQPPAASTTPQAYPSPIPPAVPLPPQQPPATNTFQQPVPQQSQPLPPYPTNQPPAGPGA